MPASSDVPAELAGKVFAVTGGGGYLGTRLVGMLASVAGEVRRLMRRPGASRPAASVCDVVGDLRDPDLWERLLPGVDIVLHLAAQTSVPIARDDPMTDLEVNVRPTLGLLEYCRRRSSPKIVVLAGTVTQAGVPKRLPVDEEGPDDPVTIYDLHKLTAERYLEDYSRRALVCGVTLRLANVYGPGPASSSSDRGILNQMVYRALRGEPLTVYGDGEWMRDYLYIDDVARAFLCAAAAAPRISGRHFVVSSGEGRTVRAAVTAVADAVARRTGNRVPVRHAEPGSALSPIDVRNFVGDSRAFRGATGWCPTVKFQDGLDRTVDAALRRSAPTGTATRQEQ